LFYILKKPISKEFIPLLNDLTKEKFILVTCHRNENIKHLKSISNGILKIISNFKIKIIFSVHLNPKIRKIIFSKLGNVENVQLINPVPYQLFIHLMKKAHLIMTDSGGMQEEGLGSRKLNSLVVSLGIPTLILRKETERIESIESGVIRLIGTNAEQIYTETMKLLKDEELYKKMSNIKFPYGKGNTSKKILKILDTLIQ
jgi:UDP-N-acetylglucosamine 2-epimerase (non-hydrolysing)